MWNRAMGKTLMWAVAAPVLLTGLATAQETPRLAGQITRPNVLWLIAEDMGPDLGVYGTPEARTPNLDRLATKGMLFTHAYTTSPVCSPSRSAFMTGVYQFTIGAHHHRSHRPDDPSAYPFPLPEGVRLLTDWLRHGGYFTANVEELPEAVGFRGADRADWNFSYQGEPFDSRRWTDLKENQPFYAQINFPEAHRGSAWNTAHEKIAQPADPARVEFPPYYPDHSLVRKDWAQYLNTVMALDVKIGKVLGLLDKEGLADHTVVIFMGDNGRAMVRGKQWPYDSGLHIPLIIYWPPGIEPPVQYRPGTVSDQLISSLDISATTLEIAGVAKPAKMQGRVFLGPNTDPPRLYVFGGRDRGDETVDRIRTVRSRRYRYIRNFMPERPFLQINRYKLADYETIWLMKKLHQEGKLSPVQERLMAPHRPPEELYDLSRDPYEIQNLADSPAHQEILRQLRDTLADWIERIDDQGRFPEDPRVVEYYDKKLEEKYAERIRQLQEKWGVK
jgi:arylsulfatase A-like enzyme